MTLGVGGFFEDDFVGAFVLNIVCIVVARFNAPPLSVLSENGLLLNGWGAADDLLSAVTEEEDLIGVIDCGNSTVLISDSSQFLCEGFSDFLGFLSKESSVFMLLNQDASGGLWFEFHEKGQMKRQWVMVEGSVHSNVGAPLNALDESVFWGLDEDACDFWAAVELMEQVTNVKWENLAGKGAIYRLIAPLPFK
ncbi:hypothetical protein AAHN93_14480 [Vandammella animalimorsus]